MAKDTKNKKVKKERKEKKENKTFFKDFKAELKKVTWPTAKQLVTKTAVVIAIVLIVSAIVFALDFVFDKGYTFVITEASKAINKEQTVIDENKTEESNENESNTTVNENATEENVTAE